MVTFHGGVALDSSWVITRLSHLHSVRPIRYEPVMGEAFYWPFANDRFEEHRLNVPHTIGDVGLRVK